MAQAAAFRERVTIYTPGQPTTDGIGGRIAGPEASLETWAAVTVYEAKPIPNEEGKFSFKQKHRIVIRYVNDPTVEFINRVEWQGKRLTVSSVVVDTHKTTITIYGYGQ